MRVYARARKPNGDVLRLTVRGSSDSETAPVPWPVYCQATDSTEDNRSPSWWDRWWILRAMEHSGYQRFF
jgi:hypothetical protein